MQLLFPDGKLPYMMYGLAEFNRFDVIEALMCIAHDWGEYALYARIERLLKRHHGRMRPNLSTDTLTEEGRYLYDLHDDRIRNDWIAKNKFQNT